jgi:hypothetical protein
LDKPAAGRVFFEQVIRDNLDAGRPDQVSLIFGRKIETRRYRPTPGRFRTRVITAGVTPSLHADYKHASIKQYHKEGKALRTETTINDTRDFRIGKRLTNLPALREVGFSASRRLLRLERLSHDPISGTTALTAVTGPVITPAGTRIPGLPIAAARSHALLAALLIFRLQPAGFTSRDLRELTAQLRGLPAVTTGQITYDLRRLRSHQLIAKSPGTHRYQVTGSGLHTAMVLTRLHDRILPAGLAHAAVPAAAPPAIRRAALAYQAAIDNLIPDSGLPAEPGPRSSNLTQSRRLRRAQLS